MDSLPELTFAREPRSYNPSQMNAVPNAFNHRLSAPETDRPRVDLITHLRIRSAQTFVQLIV